LMSSKRYSCFCFVNVYFLKEMFASRRQYCSVLQSSKHFVAYPNM
jgi:hypothetical protein